MSPADAHFNLGVLCDARHDTKRADLEYKEAAKLSNHTDPHGSDVSTNLRRP